MTPIITAITSIVTASIGWLSDFAGAISAEGNEIILLFVLFPAVGLGVGLLKRLIRA